MAGNLVAAGRIGAGLLRRRSLTAAMALLGLGGVSIAVAPALAEHAGHYAARAEANHRSVLAEILAAPLCSGEAQS
jgi:hypothetical protein